MENLNSTFLRLGKTVIMSALFKQNCSIVALTFQKLQGGQKKNAQNLLVQALSIG